MKVASLAIGAGCERLNAYAFSAECPPLHSHRLRLGLLLDSFSVPAWVHGMLRECLQIPGVELSVVVLNGTPERPRRSRLASWIANRHYLLYSLYRRIDERRTASRTHEQLDHDLREVVRDTPVITVTPAQGLFTDHFSPADIAAIRCHAPDLLVRLGFRILKGEILDVASLGIWSYHHGDNRVNRGGPPGFWESLLGTPTTGAIVQRLTPDLDGGPTLMRGVFATDAGSAAANAHHIYRSAAHLLPHALRAVASGRSEGMPATGPDVCPYSEPLLRLPTNRVMLRLWARQFVRRLRGRIVGVLTRDQWCLAYHVRTGGDSDLPLLTPYRYREIIPPPDRYWADPFPFSKDGRTFLFFEEFTLQSKRGTICVFELGNGGPIGPTRKILEEQHHLSYPFLLEHEGAVLLIPEAAESGTLSVYRARDFPFEWEKLGPLLDEPLVDATLACIDGRWWIFAGPGDPQCSSEQLLLFCAPSPLGPWKPHPGNPVKSDVRGSRPAGRLFQSGGSWYRPAQDCSIRYGRAVRLFRIDHLDEEGYSESEVGTIEARWKPGLIGVHTVNAHEGVSTIDFLRRIPRWRA